MRLSRKIFETDDVAFQWDGKYRGEFLNTAVFAYTIQVHLLDKAEITRKGKISLLR